MAANLGVSAQTASRWYQAWSTGGRAGRTRKLSGEQLAEVEAALLERPKVNRVPTEM